MTSAPHRTQGDIDLGHLLIAAGLDADEILVLRHTFTTNGLRGPEDLTPPKVLAYTRSHGARKFPANPPRWWLVFVADGQLRSRFFVAYENRGEVAAERTATHRFFDLEPTDLLEKLQGRLVIQWSKDAVNWAKSGVAARQFPVVEIADPADVPFPGFDRLLINYPDLPEILTSSRYRTWQTALAAIQAIYLITDARTGRHYVGKADGAERLLGRWTAYAGNGHGGNVALSALVGVDATHPQDFRFSILRVFGPDTPQAEIDAAEDHWKRALMSREFGHNRN